jgi:hypothetical protein
LGWKKSEREDDLSPFADCGAGKICPHSLTVAANNLPVLRFNKAAVDFNGVRSENVLVQSVTSSSPTQDRHVARIVVGCEVRDLGVVVK